VINRKNKDYISYDDTFALKYGESFVVLDKETKFLYFLNVSLDVLLSSTDSGFTSSSPYFFKYRFRPQVKVYYCEGNVCFQTELSKTDMDGVKATYKGKQVSRQTDCWGKLKTYFYGCTGTTSLRDIPKTFLGHRYLRKDPLVSG
jgi:hypothetical protein